MPNKRKERKFDSSHQNANDQNVRVLSLEHLRLDFVWDLDFGHWNLIW
jgi:hypothetical protein